ncbi:hypothetical protein AGMMS49573_10170 [Endomicrobiia bacterium]|uniref:CvpA family protein n=1 Tax=Endomicrobium trichonymphae TaxID=1408204 RepID=UPI000866182B|nr:CvpA family protein [Candidatus Endomicrobium trichonymphae]GHT06798.1 hypothetical protein AGMMS49523_09420 [Endomicrobiia bacterium]BAV58732.1 hypothetical protein RSTT_152 [Candidatus Endomicrobium trichonymphae]GHT09392.1 hypothetical protein AGMMS49532_07270 [Endomicrobiia bacterium]GHT12896.1 hypothetical protein AGMMS49571_05670 [Endomicrobiia bacterium]GHT17798.1 hypothetical protein AGMMS49573_10170 [Endomicrobiia bacterium]
MAIDIFLTLTVVLAVWLGWFAGFTRTFFAFLAGFLAVFAASKYPHQKGLNFYLVFVITALLVIMSGGFTLRLISFFYLNILDRIGGAALGACIWLVVSVNIIIPAVFCGTYMSCGQSHIYKTVSHVMQSEVPVFKDYISQSLGRIMIECRK